MEKYTFEGCYDARTMLELKYRLLSAAQIRLLIGTAILSCVLCGVCVALKKTTYAVSFGILVFVVLLDSRWQYRRIFKLNLKRASETKRVFLKYRCTFSDDGITYENRDSGGHYDIAWADLRSVVETESGVYLVTRAQQMIGLERKSMPAAEREGLYAYLRNRGVQVKERKAS